MENVTLPPSESRTNSKRALDIVQKRDLDIASQEKIYPMEKF